MLFISVLVLVNLNICVIADKSTTTEASSVPGTIIPNCTQFVNGLDFGLEFGCTDSNLFLFHYIL